MREYHWKYGLYVALITFIPIFIVVIFQNFKLEILGIILAILSAILEFFIDKYLGHKYPRMNSANYHSTPAGLLVILIVIVIFLVLSFTVFEDSDNQNLILLVAVCTGQFIGKTYTEYWVPDNK
ncbi:hypothetical protein ABVF11_00590 [Pediococcus argentinicus]|uniref:hypothetical protein n=1 Tax=Pediococcus argentinicus TaxID=480391 RepID=UPI00338F218B